MLLWQSTESSLPGKYVTDALQNDALNYLKDKVNLRNEYLKRTFKNIFDYRDLIDILDRTDVFHKDDIFQIRVQAIKLDEPKLLQFLEHEHIYFEDPKDYFFPKFAKIRKDLFFIDNQLKFVQNIDDDRFIEYLEYIDSFLFPLFYYGCINILKYLSDLEFNKLYADDLRTVISIGDVNVFKFLYENYEHHFPELNDGKVDVAYTESLTDNSLDEIKFIRIGDPQGFGNPLFESVIRGTMSVEYIDYLEKIGILISKIMEVEIFSGVIERSWNNVDEKKDKDEYFTKDIILTKQKYFKNDKEYKNYLIEVVVNYLDQKYRTDIENFGETYISLVNDFGIEDMEEIYNAVYDKYLELTKIKK